MIHATRRTVLNSLFAIHGLSALFGVLALAAGANAADTPTRRWALLIGVDQYVRAKELKYCGADQRAFATQLIESGFDPDRVFLLDDQATQDQLRPFKANIEQQLDLLLKLVRPNDVLIVGFSCHGVLAKNTTYLCPKEGNLDDPATLISLAGVCKKLERSPAALKLVLVDACQRNARPDEDRGPGDDPRELATALAQMEPPPGLLLLNSCSAGEVAKEDGDFKHGVFMHFVVKGLRGDADADHNRYVSLRELTDYASDKTELHVARKFIGSQRPFLHGDLTASALRYDLFALASSSRPNPFSPPEAKPKLDEARKSVVFVRRITPGRETALGSGFLVSPEGLIYTSRHVIRSSDATAKGTLVLVGVPSAADPDDHDWFVAEVVYVAGDDELDFAVLKIAAREGYGELHPLPLSLTKLELGASVAVIGYPYVRENQAVLSFNKGSISATRIRFSGKSYYQTDAAVNHGNSGGPLLNDRGEAVGIVTLKELDAENMGFALYLNEINSAAVAPSKFEQIHPPPGPVDLGQLRLPTTIAPLAANWVVSAGRPREEGEHLIHDNRGAPFWLTSRVPLPDDFQLVVHCAVEYLIGNQKVEVGQRPSQRNVLIRFGAAPGNPKSPGYQVQFGHAALVLTREGKAVKKVAVGNVPDRFFRLAVTKHGGRIEVAVDGKTLLEYDDTMPLKNQGKFSIGGYLSRLHLGEVTVIDLTGEQQAGVSAETLSEPGPGE